MSDRRDWCPRHGRIRHGYSTECPDCDGTGTTWHEGGLIPLPCLDCDGTGQRYECPECAAEEAEREDADDAEEDRLSALERQVAELRRQIGGDGE